MLFFNEATFIVVDKVCMSIIRCLPLPGVVVHIENFFEIDLALSLKKTLDCSDRWRRREGPFFQYMETNPTPEELQLMVKSAQLRSLVSEVCCKLDVKVEVSPIVDIHCHAAGDHIGFHTDETVREMRLLCYLTESWEPSFGGFLVFPNRQEISASVCISPIHNSGLAFVTSTQSEHGVSLVHAGTRYVLVLRYGLVDNQPG